MQRQDRADYNLVVNQLIEKFDAEKNSDNKKAAGVFLAEYIHHHHRAEWLLRDDNKLKYATILQTLMTNRKAAGFALTDDEFKIILIEGVRLLVPNILKYFILRQLTGEEPAKKPENRAEIREGYRAAALWAKHEGDQFRQTFFTTHNFFGEIDQTIYSAQHYYLSYLADFCTSQYSKLRQAISPAMQSKLEFAIRDIGATAVFQIADDLESPKLYLMLAQYYAERVKKDIVAAQEVDYVIRAYKALAREQHYVKEMQAVIASIDQALVTGSQERSRNQDHAGLTTSYRSIAAANHGSEAVMSKLVELSEEEAFRAALNYYLCVLPTQTADHILRTLPKHLKNDVLTGIVKQSLSTLEKMNKRSNTLPFMLQYRYLVEGGPALSVEHEAQAFEVNPVSFNSVYMLVTKTGAKPDNYKFYIAFNPADAQNYPKCWALLVNEVLMHDNVYGVKMVSPKEAVSAYEFPGYEEKSDHSGQPGKMAIIYFKPYAAMKLTKGDDYSELDYRKENLAVMEELEKSLHALKVTKNQALVLPDNSLALPFDKHNHPYGFVSNDTGEEDKYIVSDQRPLNTLETNAYGEAIVAVSARSSSSSTSEDDEEAVVEDDTRVLSPARERKRDTVKYLGLMLGGLVFVTALMFLIVSTAGVGVPVVAAIVGALAVAVHATVLTTSIGLICATALGAIGFGAGYIVSAYKDHQKQKSQLMLDAVAEPVAKVKSSDSTVLMVSTLVEEAPEPELESESEPEPAAPDNSADSEDESVPLTMEGRPSAADLIAAPEPEASRCSIM